jgi:hypothetical protein
VEWRQPLVLEPLVLTGVPWIAHGTKVGRGPK